VNPDCEAPLACSGGTCLTPDGEDCVDNVDCIHTCVENVCAPDGVIYGACDDDDDCAHEALVCDEGECKLDLLVVCTDNAECESNRCICSDSTCSVRTCKDPDAVCQCKWSPSDSATCDNGSANLAPTTQDPNGCNASTGDYCNVGTCIDAVGGSCSANCVYVAPVPDDPNTAPNEAQPAACNPGTPTGCAGGYDENVTVACALNKGATACNSTCQCDLGN
jgi:hypothetical protein